MIQAAKELGIQHEPTPAYSPKSNGKAEVQNRIIMDTVRTLLKQANMPTKFWMEALHAANYLRNRLPSQALPNNKSPFEMWTETPANLQHIRPFGCVVYVRLANQQREGKFSDKGKCCLVGYESEHIYRVYSPEFKWFKTSRDVTFKEKRFFLKSVFEIGVVRGIHDSNYFCIKRIRSQQIRILT